MSARPPSARFPNVGGQYGFVEVLCPHPPQETGASYLRTSQIAHTPSEDLLSDNHTQLRGRKDISALH